MEVFDILKTEDLITRYEFKRVAFGGGTYIRHKLTPLGERIFGYSFENREKSIYGIYSNHVFELTLGNALITICRIDDGEFDTPFEYEVTITKVENKPRKWYKISLR